MMPANTGQFLKMKERTEVKHFLFFKKITFHRVWVVKYQEVGHNVSNNNPIFLLLLANVSIGC